MTAPAPDEHSRIRLHALHDYEPEDGGAPPRRWSSLRPRTGPQLRLVPSAGPTPGPATLAPVLRRVLEVLDGRRPVGQLRSLLPDPAFEALLTRLRTVRPGCRHVLRRVRTCYPTTTAVEVTAVIGIKPPAGRERVVAAAARFEQHVDEWQCTVLRFV